MSDAQPSPAKIRIFISHCATGVPGDEALLKWFMDELGEISHVKVDQSLWQESETDWRQNITRYIEECDIAVSLYGKRASNTCKQGPLPYIHQEAERIDQRRKSFPALPWLIFRQQSISFDEMQSATSNTLANIPSHNWITDQCNLLERLKELIQHQLTHYVHQPELTYFAERIKDALQHKDVTSLSEWLNISLGLASHTSLITMLTEQLLRHGCECLSLVNLEPLGIYLGPERRRSLLTDLAPLWIPYERARLLLQHQFGTLESGYPYPTASKFTAPWHAKRVRPEHDLRPKIIPAGLTEQKLRDEIQRYLQDSIDPDGDATTLLEELQEYPADCGPITVILPPLLGFSSDIVSELQRDFPGVIFLHVIHHQAEPATTIPVQAPLLLPPLDFDREKRAIRIIRSLNASHASHEVSP